MKQLTILLLLLLTFCLPARSQQVVLSDSMKSEIRDGKVWAIQRKGNYAVSVTNNGYKDDYGHYYQIRLVICNLSDNDILFIPDSIRSIRIKNATPEDMKVYSYEKLMKKIRNNQMWTAALTGLSMGLASGTAAYSNTSSYNPYTGMTTYTTTYNAAAANLANMQVMQQLTLMDMKFDGDIKVQEAGYLKANTIHPGEAVSGYLNIKFLKGGRQVLYIPVNNEVFEFDYDLSNKKQSKSQNSND